jgi:ribonuclease-3
MTTNYLETGVIINKDDGTEEVYHIPYNMNNILISEKDIINILNHYSVKIDKVNHIEYFHQAFTHKSYVKKDVFTNEILTCARKEMNNPSNLMELRDDSYERLEYFGDRVVKIVVSFYLFNRYPEEDEGFMTRLQTKIEDKKNLAVLSKELGLSKYFIISKQIELQNGRHTEKIHEDVFEAFMGALFLSNGFEPSCLLILNLLETLIDYSDKLYRDNNYKDHLLRYHHSMKWKFPEYHMIGFEGPPHKRSYIMGVEKNTLSVSDKHKYLKSKNWKELCFSFGNGVSKKDGEQKASKMALILYNQLNDDQYEKSDIYYPNFNNFNKLNYKEVETDSSNEDEPIENEPIENEPIENEPIENERIENELNTIDGDCNINSEFTDSDN